MPYPKDASREVREYQLPGLYVSLVYHAGYDRQPVFEDDRLLVLIDGWIFNAPAYAEQATFVAGLYQKHGAELPYHLDGQFNILIHEKQSGAAYFWNDIFALRKHFFSLRGAAVISPDLGYIYRHFEEVSLDEKLLKRALNHARFHKIDATYVREIGTVGRASFFDLKHGSQSRYSIERIAQQHAVKFPADYAAFNRQVRENLGRVHREDEPVMLQLSGGLDSRYLLEQLRENAQPLESMTYGADISDEVTVARLVAQRNGIKHHELHLEAEDVIRHAAPYAEAYGGMDIICESKLREVFRRMPQRADYPRPPVMDTGLTLDVFLGGTQMANLRSAPLTGLTDEAFDLSDNDIFSSDLRVFSVLALRQMEHRQYFEDRYGMYSYRNYLLMRSVPTGRIADYQFYLPLAREAIRKSYDVPLQATMMGLDLPYEQWPAFKSFYQQKEAYCRQLFRESGQAHYHNHFHTDYDMWLRAHPAWRDLLAETLGSPDRAVFRLTDYGRVQRLCEDQLAAKNNHLRPLIKLMTLELFLRGLSRQFDPQRLFNTQSIITK